MCLGDKLWLANKEGTAKYIVTLVMASKFDKLGVKPKMEALTAWSTFTLAVLTFALVLLAAVNFHKFIQNINLVAKSIDQQAASIKLQTDSLNSQIQSVTLQSKDMLLNHKPVVYIKQVIPANNNDLSDPYSCSFVLTNSGKLPARDVLVLTISNISYGKDFIVWNLSQTPVKKASVYPGADLVFGLTRVSPSNNKMAKADLRIKIQYYGDGLSEFMTEEMRYILSDRTHRKWINVSPTLDIFFHEKYDELKSKYSDLAALDLSEGRREIVRDIVSDILGIANVQKARPDELIQAFAGVPKDIRQNKYFQINGLNGGALTGLQYPPLIDEKDQLTMLGVSAFKCVAEVMGSD